MYILYYHVHFFYTCRQLMFCYLLYPGSLYNTSTFLDLPITNSLYAENMFLVVKKYDNTFSYDSLFRVGDSFTWGAWLMIFIVIIIFSATIDIIRNAGITKRCFKDKKYLGRLGKSFYTSIIQFIGNGVDDPTNNAEKFALLGFSIFTLFIISTFTGSITASIVNSPDPIR